MVRLIINIIALVILAVFVSINVSYQTSINLFGYKYDNISTVAVILISLVAGVLYSFLYYLLTYIGKSEKLRVKNKSRQAKIKEKELKDREKNIDKTIQDRTKITDRDPAEPGELETVDIDSKKKSSKGLFNKKKTD